MTTRHMMPDGAGALRDMDATDDRIAIPYAVSDEQTRHLLLRVAAARELRDWLVANVPPEAFGGFDTEGG